jgi:MFS family permease
MQAVPPPTSPPVDRPQFSLAALLEFPAVCGVLCALTPLLTLPSVVGLMGMAIALAARQGLLALLMLMEASLASDWLPPEQRGGFAIGRQFMVFTLAGALCVWYRERQR